MKYKADRKTKIPSLSFLMLEILIMCNYKIDHGLNKVIFEDREQYIFRAYEDNGDKAELIFFVEMDGIKEISFFKILKNNQAVIYKVEIVDSL